MFLADFRVGVPSPENKIKKRTRNRTKEVKTKFSAINSKLFLGYLTMVYQQVYLYMFRYTFYQIHKYQ